MPSVLRRSGRDIERNGVVTTPRAKISTLGDVLDLCYKNRAEEVVRSTSPALTETRSLEDQRMATASKSCTVVGCNKPHKSKGYCASHAERVRRLGHPMARKPLARKGEAYAFLLATLEATQKECVLWPFATNDAGYPQIWNGGKVVYAHRVVCEMRNGPPPTLAHEAAHSCGMGHLGCIHPDHLSWETSAGNKADQLVHGTRSRGPAHGAAKLNIGQVRDIRRLEGSVPQPVLAQRFGVSTGAISRIHTRKNWAWLD